MVAGPVQVAGPGRAERAVTLGAVLDLQAGPFGATAPALGLHLLSLLDSLSVMSQNKGQPLAKRPGVLVISDQSVYTVLENVGTNLYGSFRNAKFGRRTTEKPPRLLVLLT